MIPKDQILFDSETKRIARRNNNRTRKQKQLDKLKYQSTTFVLTSSIKLEEMTDIGNNANDQNIKNNIENNGNHNNNNDGDLPYHNSSRLVTHMVRPHRNAP